MVEILYRAALSLVSLAVIWLVVKNRMMQKENDFLALHDQMTEQNYRLLRESAELNRHLVHDVKHHLLMLREYVKEGNLSGIEMYLDEIEDEYMYVPRKVWTGNGFLDFILSQKKSRAESKGIVFDIDSEIIPVWGLTDSEISVVFGNLLDNAIEASEKVPGEDKGIHVFIKKRGAVAAVKIRNSIAKAPDRINGKLVSGKGQPGIHGYGLKSVKRVIVKRGGYFDCHADKDEFWVNISVFDTDV